MDNRRRIIKHSYSDVYVILARASNMASFSTHWKEVEAEVVEDDQMPKPTAATIPCTTAELAKGVRLQSVEGLRYVKTSIR